MNINVDKETFVHWNAVMIFIRRVRWSVRRLPASLWTVFHVVSDLPADPAAAIVGGQLAVRQHLGVKEVVLRRKKKQQLSLQFGIFTENFNFSF